MAVAVVLFAIHGLDIYDSEVTFLLLRLRYAGGGGGGGDLTTITTWPDLA